MNDTIFALSSGYGKSGVAVIRISGPGLHDEFAGIIENKNIALRYAYFVNLKDNANNLIDQCIAIYFKGPASFTGEDVIELHCHGAPAVIEKIFEHLRTLGMRIANPGEFSKRAFYKNKMDLAEIDGLAALLDARTDKQRTYALKSMTGFDSSVYESWRSDMIEVAAYSAAILDYASDELPANISDTVFNKTQKLYTEINNTISRYGKSRAIRSGFNIVLVGETNVGKSSIFNRLVGSSRAIVSDIPGTTRDVVSTELDIDGYLVHLSDTAGLRDATDTIEKIGIEKTKSEIENADLILRVYNPTDKNISPATENEIVVINKSDMGKASIPNAIHISALDGNGMDDLMNVIKQKLHAALDGAESDISVNARTHELLIDASNELKSAIENNGTFDIFAEHVRAAADAIGKILGIINISEIADATFGQLCLGK